MEYLYCRRRFEGDGAIVYQSRVNHSKVVVVDTKTFGFWVDEVD